MWGSMDEEIHAGYIPIPEGWVISAWTALDVDGTVMLCVQGETLCDEQIQQDAEVGTVLARGNALRRDDGFFRLPEIFLEHMNKTSQDTVTLTGMEEHFEIWPQKDYERMEEESGDQLSELLEFLTSGSQK